MHWPDPSTFSGQLAVGLILLVVVPVASWFIGPLKWWWHGRALKRRLLGCNVRFFYNPEAKKEKNLRFLPGGVIESDAEHGRHNEHRWRIRRGRLEILNVEGVVYSRFAHEKSSGQLQHTNELDTHSIQGQYMILEWHRSYARHEVAKRRNAEPTRPDNAG